ncbi:hypothetical protein ACIBKY_44595 [Nonomuraea sp. NPDC050394]|uniref:hypothetical protein n=1 Tax=Nonomuraea sp. NPDC050394 TaxID=3364363 RepID=UPI0037A61CB4
MDDRLHAPSGLLGDLNLLARRTSPQRRAAQQEELRSGRITQRRAARGRLREALRERGYPEVGQGLIALYGQGRIGMEALARQLGVGRGTLRDALVEQGVALRASGATTDTGRRSRITANIAKAAAAVGAADLRRWLRERRAEGWSLRRLAERLDRSVPWVQARLAEDSTQPAP